jgi:hypothetical protein
MKFRVNTSIQASLASFHIISPLILQLIVSSIEDFIKLYINKSETHFKYSFCVRRSAMK